VRYARPEGGERDFLCHLRGVKSKTKTTSPATPPLSLQGEGSEDKTGEMRGSPLKKKSYRGGVQGGGRIGALPEVGEAPTVSRKLRSKFSRTSVSPAGLGVGYR